MGGAALSGALCLGLLWRLWAGADGSCSERCCQGRDAACVSSGWREDGGYGSCYCDGGCRRTRDCCHDHSQACPGKCRGPAPSRAPGGITPRVAVSGLLVAAGAPLAGSSPGCAAASSGCKGHVGSCCQQPRGEGTARSRQVLDEEALKTCCRAAHAACWSGLWVSSA